MHTLFKFRRHAWFRSRLGAIICIAAVGIPTHVYAICGLDGAVREQLRSVDDPQTLRALSTKIHLNGSCSVCHLARFGGPRNEYGNAINALLTLSDRDDNVRQRDAGRRMMDILANPVALNSPTFGELFRVGRFPAPSLATQEPLLTEASVKNSEDITVDQARVLVQRIESESRFGILQLSSTYEIGREVADVLAEFQGEMLIFGIKSLTPEVAAALAKSQAANVWLHSVTAVSPEAAEAIVNLRGNLVLTSLAELTSVPLAEKLAARPGALSFPYLKTMTPEIAAALAKNKKSLTLAGLRDVSPEVQEQLAGSVGGLFLPNLTSLDSLPLVRKLASSLVLLPKVEKLSPEHAEILVGVNGQASFFGGFYLNAVAMTPEVATVFSRKAVSVNLVLVGGTIPDEALRALLQTRMSVALQDVEELTPEQVRIVADGLRNTAFRPGVVELARLSLPKLNKLDSALLAETLVQSTGFNFPSVTSISPEVAAALGSLPDAEYKRQDGTVEVRPSGDLNFPSLEEFTPETARLLLRKRWLSISLPALQEVSLETVRLMARQTSRLNLGIPALPEEFADAFAGIPMNQPMAGDAIGFPNLTDLSPDAARILVKSLNRGVEVRGNTRISKSPKLSIGGFGFPASGFSTLDPESAKELAKYEGILAIQGLGELPDESAAALASFPGPYLILMGPAAEKLSPAAAESLAKVPGVLQITLRELDSRPLAERFARQINWTLHALESVSEESIPALIQYKQIFDLRKIAALESPDLARRYLGNSWGPTLPALTTISPEAAEIVVTSPHSILLGLIVLDSAETARTLTESTQGVKLPRLRAATPEVIAILKEAKTIETPAIETVFVLSNSTEK